MENGLPSILLGKTDAYETYSFLSSQIRHVSKLGASSKCHVKPLYSCAHIQLKFTLVQQGQQKNPMEKHGANCENLEERQFIAAYINPHRKWLKMLPFADLKACIFAFRTILNGFHLQIGPEKLGSFGQFRGGGVLKCHLVGG